MKAVLVTRPAGQAQSLFAALTKHKIPYHDVPAMAIYPHPLTEAQIAGIQAANILIFISRNAAVHAPLFVPAPSVFAVGESTQQALYEKGYAKVICPEDFSTEGLLALPMLQSIQGKRIAIIRGVGGRETLQTVLEQRGALCDAFSVYRRVYPAEGELPLQTLLLNHDIRCVVVTSGEILQNLLRMAGACQDRLQSLPLIVISQRIARLAKELGFCSVEIVDYKNLVRELCQKYVTPDYP